MRRLVLLVAVLSATARSSIAIPPIPITVIEPAGVARAAAHVAVGVPLPRGAAGPKATFWVSGPDRRPAPSQTRTLESWPDGSPRWILVEFLSTIAAGARATYSLHVGPPPAPPAYAPVTTATRSDRVVVSAGALAISFDPSSPGLFDTMSWEGDPVLTTVGVPEPDVDGMPATRPTQTHYALETTGPIRTEVLLTGRYASGLAYEARVAVINGVPGVRLMLTVIDRAPAPYTPVRSLPLILRGEFRSGTVGVDDVARPLGDLDPAHEVRQQDASDTGCTFDGTACHAGDGWAMLQGEHRRIMVVRRWFREEWPQAVSLSASALRLDLLAGQNEPVELGVGAAKTFELWILTPATDTAPAIARGLQHPLVAHVAPEWTVGTGAIPNALAPALSGASDVLPRLSTGIARYLGRNRAERWDDGPAVPCAQRRRERIRVGAYGALNFGDWNFPGYRDQSKGCDAWGNLEYDLPQVLGLSFAATGSASQWDAFVAAARHYRDVDVIHFAPGREDLVGFNHPHKVRHFAQDAKNEVDLGHTWLEGLLTHYHLTGEQRSLAAARGIADVLVRRRAKAGNPRQFGWPMVALAAIADATGDQSYREAAASYAAAAVEAHEPTPAASDWKMGILADGIAAVHALTGSQALWSWLVQYADALLAAPARFDDPRFALPLGYLASVTGNRRYEDLARATSRTMPIGDWGKTLAVSGRTAFRLLGPLAGAAGRPAGVTPVPAGPRPRSGAGRRRS